MLKYLMPLAGVALLITAGRSMMESARNAEPTVLTCEAFYTERPDANWLKLKECELDLPKAIIARSNDTNDIVGNIYVPVRPIGQRTAPAQVFLETSRTMFVDPMRYVGRIQDSEKAIAHISANMAEYFPQVNVTGTTGSVLNSKNTERVRKTIANMPYEVADNFIIIADEKKPPTASDLTLLLVLGALFVTPVFTWFSKKKQVNLPPAANP